MNHVHNFRRDQNVSAGPGFPFTTKTMIFQVKHLLGVRGCGWMGRWVDEWVGGWLSRWVDEWVSG